MPSTGHANHERFLLEVHGYVPIPHLSFHWDREILMLYVHLVKKPNRDKHARN